ncbi:MAG: YbaB/EbfC family nucleoid-associated protein [Verrucomicrobiota bacterium]
MAGLGKLLKQAKKMQQKVDELQEELTNTVLDVTAGGGAVVIKINGQGEFLDMQIDPEFLKEEPDMVQETILEAVKEAAAKAKTLNEERMAEATAGFQMPGMV